MPTRLPPICLLFLALLWSQAVAAPHGKTYGTIYHAQFVHAKSARVVTFDIPGVHPLIGKQIDVLVRGMDTPRLAARCNREKRLAGQARDLVIALLDRAKHITLQDVARDRAFRIRATVLADNLDIREVLYRKKLAVPESPNGQPRDWCTGSRHP